MMYNLAAAVAMLIGSAFADDGPALRKPEVGDVYEVVLDRETSSTRGDVASGSSTDVDAIVERVLAVRAGGVELQYDLPSNVSPQERRSQWQLPARIFKPNGGSPQLLNRAELEQRVDPWLKSGGMTHEACGHLIFTWNAFRIECDPDSVIAIVTAFDPQPRDLRDGAFFRHPNGKGVAALIRTDGGTFRAELPIDPDAIRRERARTKVGVGEITHKPVSLEAALRAQAMANVTGSIVVTFETDAAAQVRRRTTVTRYVVAEPGKPSEIYTVTETLERKRLC